MVEAGVVDTWLSCVILEPADVKELAVDTENTFFLSIVLFGNYGLTQCKVNFNINSSTMMPFWSGLVGLGPDPGQVEV